MDTEVEEAEEEVKPAWAREASDVRAGGVVQSDVDPADVKTPGYSFTDTANGNRLIARWGENIRYVREWKDWAVWDGMRWKPDADSAAVIELAKDTAATIYYEAADAAKQGKEGYAVALSKHAKASLSQSRLGCMVKNASTDPRVNITVNDMDTDKFLLNCLNGTVDLRTGELRPARREDLITKVTGVEYDPNAECPKWEKFIHWAACGRDELVKFLWLALGYSITGDISERMVFFLHGEGWNGKSTLIDSVRYVIGEYGKKVPSKLIESTKFRKDAGAPSPEIAELKGARFVCMSEIENGTKLATTLLKELTGKEPVKGRFLFKNPVEFRPEFSPWISANDLPDAPEDDQAIWDRMKLIPFDNRIGPDDPDYDPHLDDALKIEGSGVLAWMVRGCLEWQKSGISTPACVMVKTEDYREQMDWFKDFLEGRGTYQSQLRTPTAMRTAFVDWAKANGHDHELSQRQFKEKMESHGWTQIMNPQGVRCWESPPESSIVDLDEINQPTPRQVFNMHQLALDAVASA